MMFQYSQNKRRNDAYFKFILNCRNSNATVKDIACLGSKLMSQARIHFHFFENHTLYRNALYLTFYALKLPYEYRNRRYLNQKISEAQANDIFKLFERRIEERVPVEYITNEAYYLGYKFYVNQNVLVPRSLMHTQFKDFLELIEWENYRVLDMCAGSGCVGISLALLNPKIQVDLVDISEKALEVARINIKNYHLENRVKCILSNCFEHIQGKYDLIISNPPYLAESEYPLQPQEVKNEPKIALTSGETGLDVIDELISKSKQHLNQNSLLIVEVGYEAAKAIKKKYRSINFKWLKCRSTLGYEPATDWLLPIIEFLIQWTSYLDSIFICKSRDLP